MNAGRAGFVYVRIRRIRNACYFNLLLKFPRIYYFLH